MPKEPHPLNAARNAMQRGATPRNTAQPNPAFGKTNPIFAADSHPADGAFVSLDQAIGSVLENLVPKPGPARNEAQPGATPRNPAQPNREMNKTNPTPAGEWIDPRRLAAARLLAQGRSVPDTARQLKLNRGTVWRWQRDPTFRAELRRIHERMVVASGRRGV